MILDVVAAVDLGYKIPVAGIFRGELCEIVSVVNDNEVIIRLTDNDIYKDKKFTVAKSCLIAEPKQIDA